MQITPINNDAVVFEDLETSREKKNKLEENLSSENFRFYKIRPRDINSTNTNQVPKRGVTKTQAKLLYIIFTGKFLAQARSKNKKKKKIDIQFLLQT